MIAPVQAVVDALRLALTQAPTVSGLVTGVYGHLSGASRTAYPYVVLGRRTTNPNDGVAFGTRGGRVTVQLDVWSHHQGPSEAHAIAAAMSGVLDRRTLALSGGWRMVPGSLTCTLDEVFDEDDPDAPDQRLYHAVQQWTCDTEAAA